MEGVAVGHPGNQSCRRTQWHDAVALDREVALVRRHGAGIVRQKSVDQAKQLHGTLVLTQIFVTLQRNTMEKLNTVVLNVMSRNKRLERKMRQKREGERHRSAQNLAIQNSTKTHLEQEDVLLPVLAVDAELAGPLLASDNPDHRPETLDPNRVARHTVCA